MTKTKKTARELTPEELELASDNLVKIRLSGLTSARKGWSETNKIGEVFYDRTNRLFGIRTKDSQPHFYYNLNKFKKDADLLKLVKKRAKPFSHIGVYDAEHRRDLREIVIHYNFQTETIQGYSVDFSNKEYMDIKAIKERFANYGKQVVYKTIPNYGCF